MSSLTVTSTSHSRTRLSNIQARYWLLVGGMLGFVLSAVIILQALHTYDVAYRYFQNVALDSKTKIEDSDAALQAIAQVSTDIVDSFITTSTSQNADSSNAAVADFDTFRRDMFKVNSNLESGPETDAFNAAELAVYDEFWPHSTAALVAKARGDNATIVQEYSTADGILENKVIPNLTNVEQYNFVAMQRTEREADAAILSQLAILTGLTIVLAVLVTVLSFWLRRKVRRYLTPGLDLAMILAWLLAIVIFIELANTPAQFKSLVEDSYYSVAATQRILAISTQANRTESAEILDAPNARKWQQLFDQNDILIQQALCGYKDCINTRFNAIQADAIDPEVITQANLKLPHTGVEVIRVVPLVANVTYIGEPQAIEGIRETYLTYLAMDRQIRDLVAHNQLQAATALDTGDSDVAFGKVTAAVELEKKINADWFDKVWQDVQNTLPMHRLMFGLVGYAVLIFVLGLGVYHRYREL